MFQAYCDFRYISKSKYQPFNQWFNKRVIFISEILINLHVT